MSTEAWKTNSVEEWNQKVTELSDKASGLEAITRSLQSFKDLQQLSANALLDFEFKKPVTLTLNQTGVDPYDYLAETIEIERALSRVILEAATVREAKTTNPLIVEAAIARFDIEGRQMAQPLLKNIIANSLNIFSSLSFWPDNLIGDYQSSTINIIDLTDIGFSIKVAHKPPQELGPVLLRQGGEVSLSDLNEFLLLQRRVVANEIEGMPNTNYKLALQQILLKVYPITFS